MSQDIEIRENRVIVTLNGSIYSKEAAALRENLIEYIIKGYTSFVFDFNQVRELDSTFLGVIVTIRKRVMSTGGNVTVKNLTSQLMVLFERTRLNKIIDMGS
ncbi:STAS domain-containing protein [Anaerobacillus sp. MEB173]|uniref:STAS domain-containing protein n=1 Tax=Anaerobacillus sp. MEB173 TaxID=3383345 RepID=UPI003F9005EA